jgi:hypothetical protein
MSFRSIFWAVVVGTALLVGAIYLHEARPDKEVEQPTAALVRATGKCAECHRQETAAVVQEYERSAHAANEVNCLECHRALEGQESIEHRGFVIAADLTSKNCQQCHAQQVDQYLRSRHAAPAWSAVMGGEPFTEEQIEQAEKWHPGWVDRPANKLAQLEGPAATQSGCASCHAIGKPNPDGSIGDCTDCHSRHWASLELARSPRTCGQCHMGPDHSQIEIFEASKHGVIFEAQKDSMQMGVDPEELEPKHMPVPTCSTCHMSGLGDLAPTHDTTTRLSYFLFAPISEARPGHDRNEAEMHDLCNQCHTSDHTDRFYAEAEAVLRETNEKVAAAKKIVDDLREEGLLTPAPFDEPIEFVYFDLWHYYGRTAKHGAYMGGADFVQWHGNYELLAKTIELEAMAAEIRERHE